MGQIPLRLGYLSTERNWKPLRDEIRGLAHYHGLTDIPEKAYKVVVVVDPGHLFATCEFKERSDAFKIFGMCMEDR